MMAISRTLVASNTSILVEKSEIKYKYKGRRGGPESRDGKAADVRSGQTVHTAVHLQR